MRMKLVALLAGASLLAACQQQIPKEALQLHPDSLQHRQLQTRRFQTEHEARLIEAGASVLQDLGFNIDETESKLGIIVASKDRDATEAGQVVGAVVVAILFGVYMPVDEKQKIRASLVTRPTDDGNILLRVTFQRVVWNTAKQVSKTEPLTEPKLYQEFFDKLGQAVFLAGEEI